ncbi:DUF5302 domain-containing protein [Desertihabitans aurantiacus]|uniref:DUF5302 domain-containing protein n=1 Tax=Desertihabitans aurantiacus TaxID=2282477 RepID=UPI000DF72A41|nr:DUF5302 domain-containing protein [Desertihabitans aurantiacus]
MAQQSGSADDLKQKMREALERKRQQKHPTAEGARTDGTEHLHGVQGNTSGGSFRRKTGGGGA